MSPPSWDSGGLSFPESGVGRLARRLCVVARDHPLLFGYLTTLLRDRPVGAEQIDLVIDRRHGPPPKAPEVERRRPSNIEDQLRQRGFAFVAEPGETFRPRDAARIEHTVELLAGMEERSWPFRRRRPRPLLVRVWGQRPGRALAVLGAVALISTMLAAEFGMNDLIEIAPGTPSRGRETKAKSEAPSAPRTEIVAESTTAEPRQVGATAVTTPATSRLPAASSADRHRVPGPAFSPPPEQASLAAAMPPPAAEAPRVQTPPPAAEAPRVQTPPAEAPRVQTARPAAETPRVQSPPPAAETPRVQTPPPATEAPRVQSPRPSLPTRTASTRPAPTSAPPASTRALAAAATPEPAVRTPSDLRIELSRRPTSATGGGVVYLVRVTDLSGQPLPDARVWMQAGRSSTGALFETRLFPAEMPGTYRSGVVHPSTLPPDLTVRAIVGNRRVEAPVAR